MRCVLALWLPKGVGIDEALLDNLFTKAEECGYTTCGASFVTNDSIRTIPAFTNPKDVQGCRGVIFTFSDGEKFAPISNFRLATASLNKITELFPFEWADHYNFKCTTEDDAELVHLCQQSYDDGAYVHPLVAFKKAPVTAITMSCSKISYYRSEKSLKNGGSNLFHSMLMHWGRKTLMVCSDGRMFDSVMQSCSSCHPCVNYDNNENAMAYQIRPPEY